MSELQDKNLIRLRKLTSGLKADHLISDEAVRECLHHGRASWISALEYLLNLKQVSREELGLRYSVLIGISHVDPAKSIVDSAFIGALDDGYCLSRRCLPLFQFGDAVTTAMVDPFDQETIDDLTRRLGKHVSPVFAFESDIIEALTVQEMSRESLAKLVRELELSLVGVMHDDAADDEDTSDMPAAVDLVDALFLWSRKEKASDIHIEPLDRSIRIRFRIDGIMQVRLRLNKRLLGPILNRLKILSGADITERRRPQDGRVTAVVKGVTFEFRLSSVPTIYGEKLVLRSTGSTEATHTGTIDGLGLTQRNEARLREIISAPSGVFFVTGPTGSGKTTTLFSVLQTVNSPDVNVMTVEDPVEMRIPGINQIQVNRAIDLGFAPVLRAFLRQDPDIILIGEIRDTETAKIASEAALTGHLVLSTMHTNSAQQAVTRLIDIGVEPFLVAPSIIGVLAQRLVRRLCVHCRESYEPDQEVLEGMFFNVAQHRPRLHRAVGCPACHDTGYMGRLGIHEILDISDEMRSLISRNASLLEIEKLAAEEGFRSMRYDAVKRILQGHTSLEEVARVVPR